MGDRKSNQVATLGQEIVRLLALRGVDTVFGIPGTHNLEIYRGLEGHPEVRHVLPRHEQGAGYAADGYWRVTGKPAAVFVTSGPALANVLVAAGTAHADRVPMLVVSPGPEQDRSHRQDGWLHLTKDQHAMSEAVFGQSVRAETPEGALWALNSFLLGWCSGRDRLPAHLEVPAAMFGADVSAAVVDQLPWYGDGEQGSGVLAEEMFERLLERIRERAIHPTFGIIVGREAADVGDQISAFARQVDALVLETGEAKGVIEADADGMFPGGYLGSAAEFEQAVQAVFAQNVVFVVGSELRASEIVLPEQRGDALTVRIGSHWLERNSNLVPDLAFNVDAADLFERLREAFADRGPSQLVNRAGEVRNRIVASVPRYARTFVGLLERLVDRQPIIVGDSSQICYLGIAPLLRGLASGGYINSFGYSTLGYSVPAGIGAALGSDRPVLCVTGDGALLFSIQELMTASSLRLPLAIVVVDNGGYGEIRDEMLEAGIDALGVDFAIPDLKKVANGFGAGFVDVTELAEFRAHVERAWQTDRPTVIRIRTDALEEQ